MVNVNVARKIFQLASALMMRIVLSPVPRKDFRKKSKQEDPYEDRHVSNKNGCLIHHMCFPVLSARVLG